MINEHILERVRIEGNPLIEGDQVTLIWEGESAPQLIGDFNNWGRDLTGTAKLSQEIPGVWAYTLTLPRDAYVEYVFTDDPDDEDGRLLDPLNNRQISNGLGKFNNYFTMPDAQHTKLANFRSGTPQGYVTRHALFHDYLVMGNRRDVWFYQPPTDQPAPLVVVFDGKDYLRRAEITQIIANMMTDGLIQPVALAMIDNAKRERYAEYNSCETLLMAITELLIPMAQRQLTLINIEKNPGAFGVLGASMGGNMALYAGLRLPHIFGKVISQSGAFQLGIIDEAPLLQEMVQHFPKRPIKIWQDVGKLEWLLDENRQMHQLLTNKGYDVTYREFPAGHNFTAWRDVLPDALTTLFGV